MPEQPALVESVVSALQLLDILSGDFEPWTLSAIVARCEVDNLGYSQTKIFNLLRTLEARGFVDRTRDGRYHLGVAYLRTCTRYHRFVADQASTLRAQLDEIHKSAQEHTAE